MNNWALRTIFIFLITAALNCSAPGQEGKLSNGSSAAVTAEARAVLAEAKVTALQIKSAYQRRPVLDEIGAAEAKTGDLNAAVETAVLAYPYNMTTLTAIGERLGETSTPDQARALLLKLKGDGASTVYAFMARRQAAEGDFASALRTTESIKAPEVRRDALKWVAERQAAEGEYDGALKTLASGREVYPAGRVEPDEGQLMVVQGQLSRGEKKAARAAIATFKSDRTRATALLAGAEEFWKRGDVPDASAWLEDSLKVALTGLERELLIYLSIPLHVKLGQKERAMLAAGGLPGEMRAKGYSAVAVACAEVKDVACVNAAVERLRSLAELEGEDEGFFRFKTQLTLLNITAALIDNDQPEAASRLLDKIARQPGDESSTMAVGPKVQLQRTVIQALRGNFEDARLLATKIPTDPATDARPGPALRTLAFLQVKKSGSTSPLQWADGLTDPADRAYAFLGIAQAQLGIGGAKLSYSAIQIH